MVMMVVLLLLIYSANARAAEVNWYYAIGDCINNDDDAFAAIVTGQTNEIQTRPMNVCACVFDALQ